MNAQFHRFYKRAVRIKLAAFGMTRLLCWVVKVGLGVGMAVCEVAGGSFELCGVPVRKATLMGSLVGPGPGPNDERVYLTYMQEGGPLFLLAVDPQSGASQQYAAPRDHVCWATVAGPDGKIYLGTTGSALLLLFDPQQPEKGLQSLGRPAPTETYVWQMCVGKRDKKLYGVTYGSARLFQHDPATRTSKDLGRMDEVEQYARYVASGKNGKLYIGIGSARRDLIVYDPATQNKKSLLAGGDRIAGWVKVEEGDDGEIYASFVDGRKYRVEDEKLVPVRSFPEKILRLGNGSLVRRVFNGTESGHLVVSNTTTRLERQVDFRYRGAGADIFMVGAGPGGKVYGSTAQTLKVFSYDPEKETSIHLGGMPGGEVYSMLPFGKKLYMCFYGGAVMTLYDPENPRWNYGRGTNDNPVSYGPLGPGHLRPRAMVQGPGNKIIIGSLPDYGQHTGGLAIWGPQENRLIANIRPVVTNQSILSLTYEPVSGLVFGGTGNYGGGGTTPLAQEAVVFAFDPERRVKLYDLPLVSGAQAYRAMVAARGLVFAVSDRLSVFDPRTRKVVAELKLPDGRPLDVSLGLHDNGKIYGLTSKVLFEVDPEKLSVVELGRPPDGIDRGFALMNSGVYFARGSRLWRYRW